MGILRILSVMTVTVNQQGRLYEKDLRDKIAKTASEMRVVSRNGLAVLFILSGRYVR